MDEDDFLTFLEENLYKLDLEDDEKECSQFTTFKDGQMLTYDKGATITMKDEDGNESKFQVTVTKVA